MLEFFNLVQNENMKIYKRTGTWVMMVILLLSVLFIGVVEKYMLKNDLLSSYLVNSTNTFSLLTLFAIVIASSSVASEFSWGTIKLLLIRPVSRTKILFSKYMSVLIFSLFMMILLLVASLLIGVILFGLNEGVANLDLSNLLAVYGYNSISLVMMATFAFMISTVFRSSSLGLGLSIFLLFTGFQVVYLLKDYQWAKYILFANMNLDVYKSNSPIIPGMTLGFSITMLLIYFLIFHLLSWYVFKKRDVAA